jgi:large repetitive protein
MTLVIKRTLKLIPGILVAQALLSSALFAQVLITVNPPSIAAATAGTPYSQPFTASGGVGSYTWSALLVTGGALPSWLSINSSTGVLSGTPPANGTLSITVSATDSQSNIGNRTVSLSINLAGKVISTNLPAGVAIVNVSGTADGAATSYNANGGSQTQWSGPFNTSSQLLEYTVPPGTYTMRVISPADAAALFPSLTQAQLNSMWTAWTYNSPWLTDYLVFDSAAASNSSLTQLFSGAAGSPGTSDAASAYADAVNGYTANSTFFPPFDNNLALTYRNATPQQTITFPLSGTGPETLIFAVPDNGLSDNQGGVSVLIAPYTSSPFITTTSIPNGQAGVPYQAQFNATGGSGSYIWSGTGLPPGLTISGGFLIGTPTHIGAYSFTPTVTDPISGLSYSPSTPVNLTISQPSPALTITTTSLNPGEAGTAFSQTVNATGGYGSYTWSMTNISPGAAPISINPSTGTLTSSAQLTSGANGFQFTLTVSDTAGDTFTTPTLTLAVNSAVTISSSTLPSAAKNETYGVQLTATGGVGSYSWQFAGTPSLPSGLTLTNSGFITGKPLVAGFFNFSVTVTDGAGGTSTAPIVLVVTIPVTYAAVNLSGGLVGISSDGSTVTPIAPSANGVDLAQDAGGNFFIATGSALIRVTPSGSVSTIAQAPSGSRWTAVAVDASSNLIAGDPQTHAIWRISPDGASIVQVASYSVPYSNQTEDIRILVDVNGNYIVAEDNAGLVDGNLDMFSLTPAGTLTTIDLQDDGPLPSTVGGMTFDAHGNYMVLDPSFNTIFAVAPSGNVTPFATQPASKGLARNPVSNEYITGAPGTLDNISADGGTVTTFSSNQSSLASPQALLALPTDFPSAVDATNPLAYFRLEGSSGLSDVNGYNYVMFGSGGSVTNPGAPIFSPANNAITLSGNVGNDVTTSLRGGIQTAGSMMAWVNLSQLPSSRDGFSYVAGESTSGNDFDLQFDGANDLGFSTTCCGAYLSYAPNTSTLVGFWHMIVATFDAVAGTRSIYWDGQLAATGVDTDNPQTSYENKTGAFEIGDSSYFTGRNFPGAIDEVGVWNYSLSAAQVYSLYAARTGGAAPPVVTSLAPSSAPANSQATTLAIQGTNFSQRSTVWWTSAGGQTTVLTPTSISLGQIVVTVPSSLLLATGDALVSVVTPSGVPANQLPFSITTASAPLSGTQPANTTAYVIDENGTLLSVTNGLASTLFSGSSCSTCYDIARDAAGNLIVAAGTEIRMYTSTGVPLAHSPIAAPQGSSYFSVAVDGSGNYIVADDALHQIVKLAPDGSSRTVVYTYPILNVDDTEDVYVRVDSAGNYVVAEDNFNSTSVLTMFRITPGANPTVTPITLSGPTIPVSTGGLTFDAHGNYVNVDWNTDLISTISPTGAVTTLFNDPNQILSDPEGISLDPISGYYFLVDDSNNALYTLSSDGSIFNQILSGGLLSPGPGSVVVVNSTSPVRASEYVLETSQIVPVGGQGTLTCSGAFCPSRFYDFAADSAGNFIVTGVSSLIKITQAGASSLIATAPQGSQWISVAIDVSGNYIVADNALHKIVKVTPGGTISSVASYPIVTPNELEDVYVRIDSSGNYIVAEDNGGAVHIARITPSGTVNTVTITGNIPTGVAGLTLDANGNYVVSDYSRRTIDLVSPAGAGTILFNNSNSTLSRPFGVFRDPATGSLLIADNGNNAVYSLTPSGTQITQLAGQLPGATSVLTLASASSPVSITTSSLPSATQGIPYGLSLTATGGSGNYTWSAGGLPTGLGLSVAGLLSGTPGAGSSGQWTVTITATDASNSSLRASQIFNFYIAPPPTPAVTISSAGPVSIGVGGSASVAFTAGGGVPPYTFTASGQPAGVSINSSGTLSGSATQAGNYNASVTVRDSRGGSASTSLAINVLGLTTTSLPGGTAGQFYSASIGATGGSAGYAFTATGLPAGLSLSSNGGLSGTVKTPNTYALNISVSSGGVTVTGTLSLTIAKPAPLAISNAVLPDGSVNARYSQSFTATGGFPPYSWSIVSGTLPQGLSMSTSGVLSGAPTTAGPNAFGVQATDNAGATVSAAASLTIDPAPLVITTQSLPSGMAGVDYPQQVFGATGGVPPYAWSLTAGGLPSGMTLSTGGILNGVPSAAGSSFNPVITVTDHAGTKTSVTLGLTIRASSADIVLTSGSVPFSIVTPATGTPPPVTVGIQSTDHSQTLSYSLAVSPAASWLNVTNGNTTPDSIQVSVTSGALALTPGDYPVAVTATCTSSACNGHKQSFTVDLTVAANPPVLAVGTTLLSFATTTANTNPISQSISLQNSGGGTIGFASMTCEDAWCSVTAPSALGGGVTATVQVAVDPSLLPAGFYRTQVDIVSSAGRGSVPVTLFIAPSSTMTLAPAGSQFNMPAGSSPGNPNGSFLVSVNNPTPVNWAAAVIPGAAWLNLTTTSGTSTTAQPGTVSFSINAAAAGALAPGAYYGRIEVTSSDVANSPEDYEVVLSVLPATTPITPDPEPGGLLFITTVGGVAPPETVTVYSGSTSASTFQTSAAPIDGSGWLSVSPSIGTSSVSAPGVTAVSVNTKGLSAGIYRGGVTYALSATAVRTVNVTLIVTSTPATPAAVTATPHTDSPKASGCAPTTLAPTQTGLVSNFSAPAAWPTPLTIQLSNNCGLGVASGQVVATFSNGDPPLILGLVDPTHAIYSGTWSPRKTAAQLSINVKASAPGYPDAISQIAGAVLPNAAPVLTPHGTLHSFDPLVGAALAPGTIVAIYGQNLASLTSQPTSIPLPTLMNGTQVIIGGMQAPLYYVSAGQVNAQIPFELQPGQQYQVIVSANGALTTPDTVQLSAATPGLAAFADGTLIAQHGDGSLVSATSPAQSGEYLVAYLAGMGNTNVTLASGAASPSNPLAEPTDTPVLNINGAPSPLLFAGLTPGLVGLYQMNFQVPSGLPAGKITIAIVQNGQSSNQTTLPYQP